MEIRHDPDNPNRVAIRTGPNITAGPWFLFDINNGGFYTDGTDGNGGDVNDWTPETFDADGKTNT